MRGTKYRLQNTSLGLFTNFVFGIFVCFPSAIKHHVLRMPRDSIGITIGELVIHLQAHQLLDTKNWKDDDKARTPVEVTVNEDTFFSTFTEASLG